ncbi:hypothetical protein BFW87_09865 [Pseudomonas fluorescens]|uniref:Uncharacterized protein n=1 Tax=Pseudomonas fluorescens TaxID=294 RepID=A0A1T2YYE5_PSEFL|nr:hypothetical protein BFW87_09865 [Pseudomonas fluorescens]
MPFVPISHYSLLDALKHWRPDTQQVNVVKRQPGEIRKTDKTLKDTTQLSGWALRRLKRGWHARIWRENILT